VRVPASTLPPPTRVLHAATFKAVLDHTADGIVMMDPDGTIAYFNRAGERMFGYERQELLGRPLALLMPEKDRSAFAAGLARYLATQESSILGKVLRVDGLRKDGTTFPLELTVSVAQVREKPLFTGILRDLAERARAEEALRELEARLRTVVETLPIILFALDRDGVFTMSEGRGLAAIGRRPGEWVGRSVFELYPHVEWHLDAIRRALAGEELTVVGETEGVWFETHYVPVRDASGQVTGIMGVAIDTTQRSQLEARLRLADRMASMGTLAAGVAHEINNPLTYVIANLEFLQTGLSAPDAATRLAELSECVREAREGTERVRQIVRDLRTFSRVDEDQRDRVDVRHLLESAVKLAWNEIRHRARLSKQFAEVPLVEANEGRLGQVFLNLIINATQALPDGAADRNEIRLVTGVDAEGRVVVEVHDTGAGIAPDLLARIFDPFFTTKPLGVGTGLGLSICKTIVTSLGGEISAHSRVGQGTVFRVALPDVGKPVPKQPQLPPRVAAGRQGRILVVDDEPMIGAAVRRALAPDHEVVAVTRAQEALELIRGGQAFDLVLCDLMMPIMSGMELHRELELLAPEVAERMVFLTGGAFTPRARSFLDGVENQRFEKPFDVQQLKALVRERVR